MDPDDCPVRDGVTVTLKPDVFWTAAGTPTWSRGTPLWPARDATKFSSSSSARKRCRGSRFATAVQNLAAASRRALKSWALYYLICDNETMPPERELSQLAACDQTGRCDAFRGLVPFACAAD